MSSSSERDTKDGDKGGRNLHRGIVERQVVLYRGLAGVGTIGLEIALAIALGYLLGQWADNRWGTAPIFLCIGLGLGVVTAVRAVIRVMRLLRKEAEREEREQGNPKPLYESTSERDERKRKGDKIDDPIVERLPFDGDEPRKKTKAKAEKTKAETESETGSETDTETDTESDRDSEPDSDSPKKKAD